MPVLVCVPEELYILLKNLRHVFAGGDSSAYLVPDEALKAFLQHCSKTIGDAYFRTPRNTIKAFLDLLSIINQDSSIEWQDLIQSVGISDEHPSDMSDLNDSSVDVVSESDDLVAFKL